MRGFEACSRAIKGSPALRGRPVRTQVKVRPMHACTMAFSLKDWGSARAPPFLGAPSTEVVRTGSSLTTSERPSANSFSSVCSEGVVEEPTDEPDPKRRGTINDISLRTPRFPNVAWTVWLLPSTVAPALTSSSSPEMRSWTHLVAPRFPDGHPAATVRCLA